MAQMISISAAELETLTNLANSVTELQEKLRYLELGKSMAVSTPKEPRIADPEYFHGKRSDLKNFLSQVRLVISAQSSRFPTEKHKVIFAASFLRSTAFSWFQPHLENSQSPILENFDLFCASIQSTFGDPDEVGTAERELFSLRQTASVASYASDFRRYAAITSWNDSALLAQFYRGLKDVVKDEIAKMDRPNFWMNLSKMPSVWTIVCTSVDLKGIQAIARSILYIKTAR